MLRVTAPIAFAELHLADAISEFSARYPTLCVELSVSNHVVDLMEGSVDVAIRVGRMSDSALIARRLAPACRIVCAAPSYLARSGVPRHPSELGEHNCLIYLHEENPMSWQFQDRGHRLSVSVGGTLQSNSGLVLSQAALAGLGVVRLPSYIVGEAIRAGRLQPLLLDHVEDDPAMHIVFLPTRQRVAKVRAFVDFLCDRYGPHPKWDAWRQQPC